ncbi:flagellar hook protein FlgE [Sulfurivirga sp.]|uniref:flagellar hook protein FlgE n=1 Tax=Sulfurivirga sp. TaxID=2614236 RepID=UPI0025DA1E14|nr:flagellar hook protein FlgE [Sulfurivirga sp.]
MAAAYDLTALSGINGASQGLAVISNNLANSQTFAFKASRSEFADIFSGAQNGPGRGVRVAAITQDFSQGTLNSTGRELDMGIDGEGFFIIEDKTGKYPQLYTRNGSFKVDKNGFLTTQEGNRVLGYLRNDALSTETKPVFDTTLSPIDLDELNKRPKATELMNFDINLDGQEANNVDAAGNSVGSATANNLQKLTDPTTAGSNYTGFPDFSTNKIIYDSLGGEHRLTANYYKRDVVTAANSTVDADGDGNNDKYTSWIVQYTVEDKDPDTGQWVTSGHWFNDPSTPKTTTGIIYELRFATDGSLIDVRQPNDNKNPVGQDNPNQELPAASWTSVGKQPQMSWIIDNPLTGATDPLGNPATLAIDVNYKDSTMYAGTYSIRGVTQDGYKVGDLVGLSTGRDGVIEARYSNGRSIPVAQLALANFTDKNALDKLGAQTYAETYASGTPSLSTPQQNGFGSIIAGSLEYSNVDVANELVNMIQTQRMYQASAQVISTSKQLTQTILNL